MTLIGLKNDKEFMDKLADAKEVSEVKELLLSKGIEMTDAEIKQAMDKADQGELTEEALEAVSGGFSEIIAGIIILAFIIGIARGARCK